MKKKWILIGSIVGAVLFSGVLIFAVKQSTQKTIKVASVEELMQSGMGMGDLHLNGNITSDVSQDIYLGQNQTVETIFVKEGDSVKVGDKLISYDMTMVNLELEMKKLDREGIALNIKKAEREIKKLKATKPSSGGGWPGGDPGIMDPGFPEEPQGPQGEVVAAQTLDGEAIPYEGDGTEENPYRYLLTQDGIVKGSFLNKMAEEQVHFWIEVRENDDPAGALMKLWGQKIEKTEYQMNPEAQYDLALAQRDVIREGITAVEQLTKEAQNYNVNGDGTEKNPYKFLITEDGCVKGSFFNKMKELETNGKIFRIEIREGGTPDGKLIKSWEQDGAHLPENIDDQAIYQLNLHVKDNIRTENIKDKLAGEALSQAYGGNGEKETPYTFAIVPGGIIKGDFLLHLKEQLNGKSDYFQVEVRDKTNGTLQGFWKEEAKNLLTTILPEMNYVIGVQEAGKEPGVEPTPEPSIEPQPTQTPDPTVPAPTNPPQPTELPQPTQTPDPTVEPIPTVEPTAAPTEPAVTTTPSVTVAPAAYSQNHAQSEGVKFQRLAVYQQLDAVMKNKDFGMMDATGMTKEEIQKQIKEKEQEIKGFQLDLKEADLEIKKISRTLENQTIESTLNGIVKTVKDPKQNVGTHEPLIQVTSSEGLYVQGTISELQMDQLKKGQMLNGFSYDTGVSFTAEVREISPYPLEGQNYGESANASMYPFTAYISDAEGLKNYSFVELSPAEEGIDGISGIYVDKAFIRTEDGQYYMMVDNGNGRLKKQPVEIARIAYGTCEIASGLTPQDKIAFPYGKGVKEGAKTKDASWDELGR